VTEETTSDVSAYQHSPWHLHLPRRSLIPLSRVSVLSVVMVS